MAREKTSGREAELIGLNKRKPRERKKFAGSK